MNQFIYIQSNEDVQGFRPGKDQHLGLEGKACKVYFKNAGVWAYFIFTNETSTTFSGIRLRQDDIAQTKFYITDEKNKWDGAIQSDSNLTKASRMLYVLN